MRVTKQGFPAQTLSGECRIGNIRAARKSVMCLEAVATQRKYKNGGRIKPQRTI